MKRTNNFLRECYKRALNEALEEDKMISFNNGYPKFGYCVIMCGGGGSGKGHIIDNHLMIQGKVFDVDKLKQQYIDIHNNADYLEQNPQQKKYDMTNPQDTEALHFLIKDKGWKEKSRDYFKNAHKTSQNLPNIIFDITGKNFNEINEAVEIAKELGYKIVLCWVVASKSTAIERNKTRKRVVPQQALSDAHDSINSYIPSFVQSQYASENFEDVWIVFNNKSDDDDIHNKAIKLVNSGNGFEIPQQLQDRINKSIE
jgi:predicted kinase